jgi:hypothetical protein
MSGRLLVSIAYRHLREPLRHLRDCAEKCASGCAVSDFHTALAEPVLPSEIVQARREEERFKALARGEFS